MKNNKITRLIWNSIHGNYRTPQGLWVYVYKPKSQNEQLRMPAFGTIKRSAKPQDLITMNYSRSEIGRILLKGAEARWAARKLGLDWETGMYRKPVSTVYELRAQKRNRRKIS